jgi:hypothetical protein
MERRSSARAALDLFHAERHAANSTFRVDTTLSFVNCGTVILR